MGILGYYKHYTIYITLLFRSWKWKEEKVFYRLENIVHVIFKAGLRSKLNRTSDDLIPKLVLHSGVQPFQS